MPEEVQSYVPEGAEPILSNGAEPEGQEPQPTDGADEPTAQPTASDFDPTQWTLKHKGQTVTPKDRNHLMTLATQGYGSAQLVEKMNRERQENEAKYARYAQLEKALGSNPELANDIWERVQQHQSGTPQQMDDMAQSLDPAIAQKLQTIESRIEEWDARKADEELEREVAKIRSDFPDAPWDEDDGNGTLEKRLLRHMANGNFPSVSSAYKDYMWDHHTANTKAAALKKAADQRAKAAKQGVVSAGGPEGAPPSPAGYQPNADWSTRTDAAIADLKRMQTQ